MDDNMGPMNVYYGIGLCGRSELSKGLPIDVLGLILTAEKLRRATGGMTYQHVADTHAKANGFDANQATVVALKTVQLLDKINSCLGLENNRIVLSSEIDRDQSYLLILQQTSDIQNEYVRREVADMLWYQIYRSVEYKVGWSKDGMADERFFDCIAQEHKIDLKFIYTEAASTLNPQRPFACPYVVKEEDDRIILDPDEQVQRKLSVTHRQTGRYVLYLSRIVAMYEELIAPIPAEGLSEKVQFILNRIFKKESVETRR